MSLLLAGLIYVTGFVEPGVTASGTYTHPGTAACPQDVAFGTRLMLEGVGPLVCEDRYAPWLSPRVDVWVPTVEAAYALTGTHAVRLVSVGAEA